MADIEIQKLDFEFISDYYFYLRSNRKCGHNTTVKYLKNFKKIVLQCVKKGWLNKDPFYGFNLATKEVERDLPTQSHHRRQEHYQIQGLLYFHRSTE
jgi:hypothetical protein